MSRLAYQRVLCLGLGVLGLACGPAVVLPDEEDSASSPAGSTSGPDPTGDPPSPSTTSPSTTALSTTTDDPDPSTGFGSTGGDSGATFISDPTGASGCGWASHVTISIECSLFVQDCCPGEKCMPWANDGGTMWNATKCAPVDPVPNQLGEPCTVMGSDVSGVDDCDLGLMCWNVDPATNEGVCASLCQGDNVEPTCPADGLHCMYANDGALPLCLPTCDPLDVASCEQGTMCAPSDATFVCLPQGAEALPEGVTCEFPTDCAPGSTCVASNLVPSCNAEELCCTPFCDLLDPGGLPCPDGTTCTPWFEEGAAPKGQESVGICLAP